MVDHMVSVFVIETAAPLCHGNIATVTCLWLGFNIYFLFFFLTDVHLAILVSTVMTVRYNIVTIFLVFCLFNLHHSLHGSACLFYILLNYRFRVYICV